jgi:hypothetical protein
MNIFRTVAFRALAFSLALPLFALLIGCDVDSVDSTASVISDNDGTIYNFSGLYLNNSTNGLLPLVFPTNGPSGKPITSLRLLQYGSVLEAFDSANQTWSGSISALQGGSATFGLSGHTTAGQAVEVAGTMTYSAQESTMNASWIEPTYFGTLYAKASVPPAATNSSSSVSIDPSSAILTTSLPTRTFSATGGDGTYSWTHTGTCGTLSGTSGSSIIYTRTSIGSDILTVTSSGNHDSAAITCQ